MKTYSEFSNNNSGSSRFCSLKNKTEFSHLIFADEKSNPNFLIKSGLLTDVRAFVKKNNTILNFVIKFKQDQKSILNFLIKPKFFRMKNFEYSYQIRGFVCWSNICRWKIKFSISSNPSFWRWKINSELFHQIRALNWWSKMSNMKN